MHKTRSDGLDIMAVALKESVEQFLLSQGAACSQELNWGS